MASDCFGCGICVLRDEELIASVARWARFADSRTIATIEPERSGCTLEPRQKRRRRDGSSLFNGRDLTGWYTFLQKHGKDSDPDHVIAIEDNAIHLYKDAPESSQVVMGYIGTEKEYGNYHLRFQYRWGTKKFQPRYALKRDAGLYYHLNGPDAVWPRGLQFQIQQTDVGDLLTLFGFALDTWIDPKTRDNDQATFKDPDKGGQPRVLGGKGIGYQKRLPGDFEVDGWNTIEVIAKGDTTVAHAERPRGQPGAEHPIHGPREAGQHHARDARAGSPSRSKRPRSSSGKWRSEGSDLAGIVFADRRLVTGTGFGKSERVSSSLSRTSRRDQVDALNQELTTPREKTQRRIATTAA